MNGNEKQPMPPPPQQRPTSVTSPLATAAYCTNEVPPKRRRIAHSLNQIAVSQPNDPDAVSDAVPGAVYQTPVVHKAQKLEFARIILKMINWGWDAITNQLVPVIRELSYERIEYQNTNHWKKCVFSLTIILIYLNAFN